MTSDIEDLPVGFSYIFLGKTSIQILCQFCNWVICWVVVFVFVFFAIELCEFS